MLCFKTKITSIVVSGVFIIDRRGKNPLHEEFFWVHLTNWKVKEDSIYLKIGAYSIDINVKNKDNIVDLIKKHLRNPYDFMYNNTTIKVDKITIKEI